MIFQNEHSYEINDPELQYFITNTQFDREITNVNINFLNDMKNNINSGVKKSNRYYFIEDLYSVYQQMGSGLNQYIFLQSDPDEVVDQLKLLTFEKVGGNDNPKLKEQIRAIIDKLLEYECFTDSHQNTSKLHQNKQSNFKKDPFVD